MSPRDNDSHVQGGDLTGIPEITPRHKRYGSNMSRVYAKKQNASDIVGVYSRHNLSKPMRLPAVGSKAMKSPRLIGDEKRK